MGIVAGLAVPLRVAGEVIGVLSVGSPTPRVFAEREIALLQAFADQAADRAQPRPRRRRR